MKYFNKVLSILLFSFWILFLVFKGSEYETFFRLPFAIFIGSAMVRLWVSKVDYED